MSKEIILVAAIGAAVLLVIQKQAQARNAASGPALAAGGMTAAQLQAAGLMYTPENRPTANVNGDMWTRLLGTGWQYLQNAQNADGSPAFLKNIFGQVTTTDGKPVSDRDPIAYYSPIVEGLNQDSYAPDYLGSISQFDFLLDGGGDRMGW
jgi:hypothetical protein